MRVGRARITKPSRSEAPAAASKKHARGALQTPLGPVTTPKPIPSPAALTGPARSEHLRQAILDYEAPIIAAHPTVAAEKLTKLADSAFVFFRGTADLFFRDLAGLDHDRPRVMSYGDLHPENLGVLRAPDGALFYGFDDFDEAHPAPFTWDLRRGATALELATRERNLPKEERAQIVDRFIQGYLETLLDVRENGRPAEPRFTAQSSPAFIEKLLESADKAKRETFLEKLVDLETGTFQDPKLARQPQLLPQFQKAVGKYRKQLHPEAPKNKSFYTVKDVAERFGAGTGSIGLRRYYLLVEGKSKGATNDYGLELKERRPSVLSRHVALPALQRTRTESASLELWQRGDRFSGVLTADGVRYKVRERHPAHDRVSVAKLSLGKLGDYARMMGALTADVHVTTAFATQTAKSKQIARQILASLDPEAFRAELQAFGAEAADRVVGDHAAYRKLLEAGAFGSALSLPGSG